MIIKGSSVSYEVGKQVAKTNKSNLYLCAQTETGHSCLLQIATTSVLNDHLARAAFILQELKRHSDGLEEEYARVKPDPNIYLNYDLSFPEVVDSFICKEQGNRQVNILAFRKVEDVSEMVPLLNITAKDKLRVDLRTSVWILGRILKLLDFIHSQGISAGIVDGTNICIHPDKRYAVLFDWSSGTIHEGEEVPTQTQEKEISAAAKAAITVLGGNPETGEIPDDDGCEPYTDYLMHLARESELNAEIAHKLFYEAADRLWKREFWPFTTKPL